MLAYAVAVFLALAEIQPANAPNRDAVAEVLAGDRTEANAAWWGFNMDDATDALQAAINSGARKLTIPYMGAPWVVRPITLASNQEILFEPGVVVLAQEGEFKGRGDSLFTAKNATDVTLIGYGATLRMHKQDYQGDAYEKAEWRMTLDFMSCTRVKVYGLRLESSGGDGIYLGNGNPERPYCEDVHIRDVVCDNHHRQGISVISAKNLLIENCVLANTSGTAPQAGIDFEPNRAEEQLTNCVMRNCLIEGNAGAGVLVYLKNLSDASEHVSLHVQDCYIRSGRDVGIGVGAVRDNGPDGVIEFVRCTIENTTNGGIFVYDKAPDRCRVRFVNCNWKDVGMHERGDKKRKAGVPLLLTVLRPQITKRTGGIDFIDCHVYDTLDRPVLVAEGRGADVGIGDLHGHVTVHSPHAPKADYKCEPTDVD
ncbi:MAG TPA: right-handed parallel beta-helix repeat-containing protein, partial [Candidatus Hydrogenedentes bacterium]|nr:right-handed parallel beta-helix repeat-containing protein [Candidatus Hydrogenedentota bacterium]